MNSEEMPTKENYPGSVLLRSEIKKWVDEKKLIVDGTFKNEQLKRAKYNVRLGETYFQAEELGHLSETDPYLRIEPYELVFVESLEIFNIPENIVARYDLRVGKCLEGIGLQVGLQLDPTYHGRFFCPLFNFSSQPVTLIYKNDLASMQFIYTTIPTEEDRQTEAFDSRKKDWLSLEQALPDVPRVSGLQELYGEVQKVRGELRSTLARFEKTIEEESKKLAEARNETQNVNTVFLAVVGLVLTAISAILVPEAIGRVGTTSLLTVLIIGVVFLITVFMLLRFVKSLFKRDNPQSPPKRGKDDSETTKE